jgi:hypothetical protein
MFGDWVSFHYLPAFAKAPELIEVLAVSEFLEVKSPSWSRILAVRTWYCLLVVELHCRSAIWHAHFRMEFALM